MLLAQSGEGIVSIKFLIGDKNALVDNILLSCSSAIGQLFIFYTIKEFGAVTFTIVMTSRQVISLGLSCILFGHPIDVYSGIGASLVILVIIYRLVRRKGSD